MLVLVVFGLVANVRWHDMIQLVWCIIGILTLFQPHYQQYNSLYKYILAHEIV